MNNHRQSLTSYRSPELVQQLADAINNACQGRVKIMQVCGTHTWSYRRHGLATLLTQNLSLVAGPGCPVCVTDQGDLDWIMDLAGEKQNTLVTFGDLMRVPGSNGSLAEMQSRGADIRVVLSPLKALDIALAEPSRRVILVAIGFETTAPVVAATLQHAHRLCLTNFSIVLLLKRLIPALRYLFARERPDGLLCPGHVATVVGKQAFACLPRELGIPSAIAGFEPVDMLLGLLDLAHQLKTANAKITNAYPRVVTEQGNPIARSLIEATFEPAPSQWRGLGELPTAGYGLRGALQRFGLNPAAVLLSKAANGQCLCHLVILGKHTPQACPRFRKNCTPENPLGPCMVSEEGTCAAHYYYPDLDESLEIPDTESEVTLQLPPPVTDGKLPNKK